MNPSENFALIRAVAWDDLPAIHAAIPEFMTGAAKTPDGAHFRDRAAAHGALALAAFDPGGAACGYLVAYDRYHDGSYYCWMAGVVPAARRQGVLRSLMTALAGHARDAGYKTLRIKTRNDKIAMLRWLIADGWQITAVDKRAPLADSRIELIKTL